MGPVVRSLARSFPMGIFAPRGHPALSGRCIECWRLRPVTRADGHIGRDVMEQMPVVAVARTTNPTWLPPSSRELRRQIPYASDVIPQGFAGLLQATVEAHTALAETIVAAATVAQRARSLTIVLEEALVTLAAADGMNLGRAPATIEVTKLAASLSPREREVLAL